MRILGKLFGLIGSRFVLQMRKEGWGLRGLEHLIYPYWVNGVGGCWLIRRDCGTGS